MTAKRMAVSALFGLAVGVGWYLLHVFIILPRPAATLGDEAFLYGMGYALGFFFGSRTVDSD